MVSCTSLPSHLLYTLFLEGYSLTSYTSKLCVLPTPHIQDELAISYSKLPHYTRHISIHALLHGIINMLLYYNASNTLYIRQQIP
jgi:hypothetical protein